MSASVSPVTSGDEMRLANALASIRQFLDEDLDLSRRVALLNAVEASDAAVAAFIAALPGDELLRVLTHCERPGVLDVWAHSIGRVFRKAVAENPWVSDTALVTLAADYDAAVSAAAYAAIVLRAGETAQPERDSAAVDPV